jgi:4-hydroxy-tetrahydrodipicolinate synthase
MTLDLEGVYVPVVTPFDGNGDFAPSTLTAVIERSLDAGVRGIVSCGTTGEYYALSETERIEVMRHTHEVAAGRARLVAGCNAGSTRMAILLARLAGDIGYDALMLAAPPTSLPRAHELAAHFSAIAEASGLPTILYNYPARSGVEIGFDCLDGVADHPLIVGIKESSSDFSRFLALRDRYAGRITIMCGSDDQAADYFFWGVRSWLAGTANVLPREHVQILDAANSGDLAGARKQFEHILPWVQHMEAGSYNQKTKLGLRHLGLDCGEVRQPLLPLSDADAATLIEILDGVLR